MNEFDGTAGSNCIEGRNVDAYGNTCRELNGDINWESDATSDRNLVGQLIVMLLCLWKKITAKTNGKSWKLRATCALNLQFCIPMESMCKYCTCDSFYVDRASSILLMYVSRDFNVFICA